MGPYLAGETYAATICPASLLGGSLRLVTRLWILSKTHALSGQDDDPPGRSWVFHPTLPCLLDVGHFLFSNQDNSTERRANGYLFEHVIRETDISRHQSLASGTKAYQDLDVGRARQFLPN